MNPFPPTQPTLTGNRVYLRPFDLEDASAIQTLAGAREVAATTLLIPHPYPDGAAEEWIRTHAPAYTAGTGAIFGIIDADERTLIGAIGLAVSPEHEHAELGYWIGVPFWNRGYATEAARLLLRFALVDLRLNRVFAHHFSRNPASGRVMQKLGMQYEGRLRGHVQRWGRFEDLEHYGILRDEWLALESGGEGETHPAT